MGDFLNNKHLIALFFAMLAWCYFIYTPGLDGEFFFDDKINIERTVVDNLSWDSLYSATMSNESGPLKRPISALSFALTSYFSGDTPRSYKEHNLYLHLLCGILLFFLVKKITLAISSLESDAVDRRGYLLAFFVASVWMVHPLLVSTVLYSVQRMAQLSTLFTLASMLCYCHIRSGNVENKFAKIFYFVCIPAFAVLSILSKENGALLPIYLLLIEWLIFKFDGLKKDSVMRLCFVLFSLLPIILGGVFFVLKLEQFIGFSGRTFGLLDRVYTQINVLVYYIKMMLFPIYSDFGLYHDDFQVYSTFDSNTIISAVILVTILVASFVLRKKYAVISFGIFLFFSAHLLESTIFPLEMVFEHRNYLALFGIVLSVAYALFSFCEKRVFIAVFMIIVCLFSFVTYTRSDVWGDNEKLMATSVLNHPLSVRSRVELANVFFNKRMYSEGASQLVEASKLSSTNAGPEIHLLNLSCYTNINPSKYYASALEKLTNFHISPYSLSGINSLNMAKQSKKCPKISLQDINGLIGAALNGKVKQGNSVNLRMLLAQNYYIGGLYDKSMDEFDVAFSFGGGSAALKEKFITQIMAKKYLDASMTVKDLEKFSNETGKNLNVLHKWMRKVLSENE